VFPKKRAARLCCVYGCQEPLWIYGRCSAHFRSLDLVLFERLKNMTRAQRKIEFEKAIRMPERPKWEYKNEAGEQELIRRSKETESEESKNGTGLCSAR
jgi:hypothetical protein